MYHVYVLRNPLGRLYIGITGDVATRFAQHNDGSSKWTAKYRPWQLIWTSRPMSLGACRRLENAMKRQKAGDGLHILIREYGS